MKVTLSSVDDSDSWKVELDVDKDTTIRQFKEKLALRPDAPPLTKTCRILFRSGQGPIYTLQEHERVKRTMLFADPSAPKKLEAEAVLAKPKPAPKSVAPPKPPPGPAPAQASLQPPPSPKPAPAPAQVLPASPPRKVPGRPTWESRFVFPHYDQMSQSQRDKITSKLQSCWPRVDGAKASTFRTVGQVIEMLHDQAHMVKSATASLLSVTVKAFGWSADMLEIGPSGFSHMMESIVYTADEIFRRFLPILPKYGFSPTVAGYAEMDTAINFHIERPEVRELMAPIWFLLTFGGKEERTEATIDFHNTLWLGIQTPVQQLVSTPQSYLHHLALPPLERRKRSVPRTIAFVEALLTQKNAMRLRRRKALRRVVWVLGASDEVRLAQEGYFEDAAAFLQGEHMTVHFVGHELPALGHVGYRVQIETHSWTELFQGKLPEPEYVMVFHSGLGTLEPARVESSLRIFIELLAGRRDGPPPVVVLTSRCLAEVQGEEKLLQYLQAVPFMNTDRKSWPFHTRNPFSGMAGDPFSEYDDNGWLIAVTGSTLKLEDLLQNTSDVELVCARAKELKIGTSLADLVANAAAPVYRQPWASQPDNERDEQETKKKDPAVFWGILDLKYNPEGPLEARVKVLETGDGRSSRFSGYGAAILENFKQDHKLEETLRRAVLVENKKLTHDLIVDSGYDYIRPRQECFPKVYTKGLGQQVQSALGLNRPEDICVLKLPNRTRGAGVIPIRVSELEEVLRVLLQPPESLELWLRDRDPNWSRNVSWGCFDEQLRHWWSNESPCFLAEEFCCSVPTYKEIEDGVSRPFDGTMRVGFSLHREPEMRLPPGWVNSDNGPLYVGTEDQDGPVESKDPAELFAAWDPTQRPCYHLFPQGPDVLRLQWLGGYWKLPVEDTESPDLRGRVVSVAKRGTAPVPAWQLHEVYAALGNVVAVVFNTKDISHSNLLKRYTAFPELSAFMVGRLACSMRIRDRAKSNRILMVANSIVSPLNGMPRDVVVSYIERNQGVMEAMHGRWKEAQALFRKSLITMPSNATSRFLLGFCSLELGEYKESIALMEDSLQLDPDFKAPYVNIGVAWVRLRDYDKAIEVSLALEQRHPSTPQCLYNLGVARYAKAALAEDSEGVQQELRKASIQALEAAHSGIGKDGPWNERDDQLLLALKDESKLLDKNLTFDGWRFINWRP